MSIELRPIELREANLVVDAIHRHHGSVRGHRFSVSVRDSANVIHGVGIAGRPKSKEYQKQGYIEIVRIASDGTPNVCSLLYGALRRASVALGYQPWKVVTYTLLTEPGSSLRAAGFVEDGITDGGSWNRNGRPRTDKAPIEPKRRWLGAKRPEPADV